MTLIAQLHSVLGPAHLLVDGSSKAVASPLLPEVLLPNQSTPEKVEVGEDFARIFAREMEQNLPVTLPRLIDLPAQVQSATAEGDQEKSVDTGEEAKPNEENGLEPPTFLEKALVSADDTETIPPDPYEAAMMVPTVPDRNIMRVNLPTVNAIVPPEGDWQKQPTEQPSALPPGYPEASLVRLITDETLRGSDHQHRSAELIVLGKWMALHHEQTVPPSPRLHTLQNIPETTLGTLPFPVVSDSESPVPFTSPTIFTATTKKVLPEHMNSLTARGPALSFPTDAYALDKNTKDQSLPEQLMDNKAAPADPRAPIETKSTAPTTRVVGLTETTQVLQYGKTDTAQPALDESNKSRFEPAVLHGNLPSSQPTTSVAIGLALTDTEKSDRPFALEMSTAATGQSSSARTEVLDVRSELQRPELTKVVVQQMVDASIRAVERPIELHLNPEELGRVRINMTITDALVTLNVVAERAETLDLMRRHSELLAQELRQLGYGTINFSFGQNGTGQEGSPDGAPGRAALAANDSLAPADIVATPRYSETSLDIRL